MALAELDIHYQNDKQVWRIETRDEHKALLGGLYFKEVHPKILKLLYITVHHKGAGVGGYLLDALITYAQQKEFEQIIGDFIPVPEYSNAAELLYRSRGFSLNTRKNTIQLALPKTGL